MAEAPNQGRVEQQGTPTPASQPGAAQPSGGGGGTPAGQPAAAAPPSYPWHQDPRFKDKGPDDVWNTYRSAESQIGQLGQYRQFAEQVQNLAQQYGGLDNLLALAQFGANAYRERQSPQQAQQQQQQWLERWDTMTPQEQAQTMFQQLQSQILPYAQQIAAEIRTQLQQENQQALSGVQRQWDIYQRLLTRKIEDPSLPMEGTLQNMIQLAQSDPQKLMDLAIDRMTLERQIQQKADAIAQARIADFEREQKNKQLQALTSVRPHTGANGAPAPRNAAERKNHVLSTLLEKGVLGTDQI